MTLDSGMFKGGRDPITNKLVKRIEAVEDELGNLNETVNTENVNAENVNSTSLDTDIAIVKQLSGDNVNVSGSIEARSVNVQALVTKTATVDKINGNVDIDGNVNVKDIAVDKITATNLELENRNFPSLNVTGDTVLNKTAAEEVTVNKFSPTFVIGKLSISHGFPLLSFTVTTVLLVFVIFNATEETLFFTYPI